MDTTRIGDLQELDRVSKNPNVSSWQREQAKQSIHKIQNESSKVRDMRQRLVQEMKNGNAGNVRDITEFVRKHSEYQ